MSTTLAGRIAATTGCVIMIIAAVLSIMKMYEIVARTPFTTSDLLPAVAVIAVPTALLSAVLLRWWRRPRAGWLMIVFAALSGLAIMNVGVSTSGPAGPLSSNGVTTEVLAAAAALLVVVGFVVGRRARGAAHPRPGAGPTARAAIG